MERRFNPAGTVISASFCRDQPLFINGTPSGGLTKAQREGLRYEARAQSYIDRLISKNKGKSSDYELLCNPWIVYHNLERGPTSAGFCQPDIVLRKQDTVTIIECKIQHTNDSWLQMRKLYEPVLRKIYPRNTKFALLEICKWFDPHIPYNETFYYCEDPLLAKEGKLGVHIYKPRSGGRTENLLE